MQTEHTLEIFLENKNIENINTFLKGIEEKIYWKYGINLSFSPSRSQPKKGMLHGYLQVSIDKRKICRNAGRKPKKEAITMKEALDMEQNGISKTDIAKMMGVAISTYYKKRKTFLGTESRMM